MSGSEQGPPVSSLHSPGSIFVMRKVFEVRHALWMVLHAVQIARSPEGLELLPIQHPSFSQGAQILPSFRTVERCFALKSRMLPIPRKSNLPPHFCTNPGSESGLARVQQETDNMTQTPGKSKKSKREVKDRLKAASSCLSGRTGKSLRDVALSRKTLGARFIIAMLLNVKLATNEA